MIEDALLKFIDRFGQPAGLLALLVLTWRLSAKVTLFITDLKALWKDHNEFKAETRAEFAENKNVRTELVRQNELHHEELFRIVATIREDVGKIKGKLDINGHH